MANQTQVALNLPKPAQVKAALRKALLETASEFVRDSLDKMKKSKPRGRTYYSRRKGFHRASARGQRPALDTLNLYKAMTFKLEKDELKAVAYILPKPNPDNGQPADKYAEILQGKLGRKIMTQRDAGAFRKVLRAKIAGIKGMIR